MTTERLVLCRPMAGLNDSLCQIERCCQYAERFGRKVVVDTNAPGSPFFRDDFSNYFSSRQSLLVLSPAELGESLDDMEVHPSAIAGRVTRHEIGYDLDRSCYVEAESLQPLTFDFDRDYPERLIVHQDFGGGRLSLGALARLRLRAPLRTVLLERMRRIGPRYSGVHVRFTDRRVAYEGLLTSGDLDPADPIFVATDNGEVVARFRDAFGAERVHNFADLPDLGGRPLHIMDDAGQAYERNRDAIVDLVMLALSTQLHLFQLGWHDTEVQYSGFSRLAAMLRGAPTTLAELIAPSAE